MQFPSDWAVPGPPLASAAGTSQPAEVAGKRLEYFTAWRGSAIMSATGNSVGYVSAVHFTAKDQACKRDATSVPPHLKVA
eukprot:3933231-Rhodomonas_salina.2